MTAAPAGRVVGHYGKKKQGGRNWKPPRGQRKKKHKVQICFCWRRLASIPVLGNRQLGLGLGPKAGQVSAGVGRRPGTCSRTSVLGQHFHSVGLAGGSGFMVYAAASDHRVTELTRLLGSGMSRRTPLHKQGRDRDAQVEAGPRLQPITSPGRWPAALASCLLDLGSFRKC